MTKTGQNMTSRRKRSLAWALAMPMMLTAGYAFAMSASCQQELDKHGTAREEAIQKINAFNKKRPTATAACGAFNNLTGIENAMLKWMVDNQTWCQLPDPFVEQFKQAVGQTTKVRGQVCTAAKKEKQMREQGGGAQRGPAVGGGVRLPQGAL